MTLFHGDNVIVLYRRKSGYSDCYLAAVLCVIVDFFFALFPWMFVWKLNMNRREKLVINLSMSLGIM